MTYGKVRNSLAAAFLIILCGTVGCNSCPSISPRKGEEAQKLAQYATLERTPQLNAVAEAADKELEVKLDQQLTPDRRKELGPARTFIRMSKKWEPGATLTVAFLGGNTTLYSDIAETANQWTTTQAANIQFDFGPDPAAGRYRTWSTSDQEYKADIRISFSQTNPNLKGYWSALGRDSIESAAGYTASHASMNFEGFHRSRPRGWRTTVLHEFGHALGFMHEHISCVDQFRWENERDYDPRTDSNGQFVPDRNGRRPGIYTVLGGPPNEWSRTEVDQQFRVPASSAYDIQGRFDAASVMKYYLEEWMFIEGSRSACFRPEATQLSQGDRDGAARFYPREPSRVRELSRVRERMLSQMAALRGVSSESTSRYRKQLKEVRETLQLLR